MERAAYSKGTPNSFVFLSLRYSIRYLLSPYPLSAISAFILHPASGIRHRFFFYPEFPKMPLSFVVAKPRYMQNFAPFANSPFRYRFLFYLLSSIQHLLSLLCFCLCGSVAIVFWFYPLSSILHPPSFFTHPASLSFIFDSPKCLNLLQRRSRVTWRISTSFRNSAFCHRFSQSAVNISRTSPYLMRYKLP